MFELSGLFVCLGGLILSSSVPEETEKIAGLWFARGVSTQVGCFKVNCLLVLELQPKDS